MLSYLSNSWGHILRHFSLRIFAVYKKIEIMPKQAKIEQIKPFWPTVPKFTAGNSFGFPEMWFADNDVYITGSPDICPVSFNSRLKNRESVSNRWHTLCTDWMISSQFVLDWMIFSHFVLCGSTRWLAIGIIFFCTFLGPNNPVTTKPGRRSWTYLHDATKSVKVAYLEHVHTDRRVQVLVTISCTGIEASI